MTHQDEAAAAATDRLRRALLAFQSAQNNLLGAHRQFKELPPAEVDAFWNGPGRRLEAAARASAAEVVAAFKRFSAAGLVADAADRHRVTEAQRHLAEGPADDELAGRVRRGGAAGPARRRRCRWPRRRGGGGGSGDAPPPWRTTNRWPLGRHGGARHQPAAGGLPVMTRRPRAPRDDYETMFRAADRYWARFGEAPPTSRFAGKPRSWRASWMPLWNAGRR